MKNTLRVGIPLALLCGLAFLVWRYNAPVAQDSAPEKEKSVALAAAHETNAQATREAQRSSRRSIVTHASYEGDVIRLAERFRKKTGMTLDEAIACQQIYNDIYRRREEIELRIAERKEVDSNKVEIEIPAFAEGAALESEMIAGFSKILGDQKAKLFLADAQLMLSDRNHNWGRDVQLITIDRKTIASADQYHIVHSSYLANDSRTGAPLLVSESDLALRNLDKYAYLKPLFPKI